MPFTTIACPSAPKTIPTPPVLESAIAAARDVNHRTQARYFSVLIALLSALPANESAHRWRPLPDSRTARLRGGAAIRCSALLEHRDSRSQLTKKISN